MTGEMKAAIVEAVPLGRTGPSARRRPRRLPLLASDEATYVTGHDACASNGGMYM